MPFDEIHTIQKDLAGMGDVGDINMDIPYMDAPDAGLFDMNFGGLDAAIDESKATLGGFWQWIKDEVANWWDGVRESWAGAWEAIKYAASALWGAK